MKAIGVIALVIGILVTIVAFNMDATVATDFGGRVNNIGLMDQRRNFIIVGSLIVIVGVLFTGFASMGNRGTSEKDEVGYRACPYCAESIRVEAKLCKHCQRELPSAVTEVKIPVDELPSTALSVCFDCSYYRPKSKWDLSSGQCDFHNEQTNASDRCTHFSAKSEA